MQVTARTGNTKYMLLGLALCTLVAGGVRFTGLSTRDFWYDESCTYIYVANLFDWTADSDLLTESTNLPYYLLLRGWSAVLGDSEAGYRSLSALAATLTVPLVGLVAWRGAGRQAGMVAAALAALNPLHIYYAHEARAYALWMLALTVMLGLLLEAARRERARWWIAYGLVALFALPLHYYTFFWLPGSVLCVALGEHPWRTFRRWLVTTLLIGLCFTPYFVVAVLPAARSGGDAMLGEPPANPMTWLAQAWEPATALGESLWALLPAGAYPAHLHGLSLASRQTVAVGSAGLMALARTVPVIVLLIAALMVIGGLLLSERYPRACGRERRAGGGSRLTWFGCAPLPGGAGAGSATVFVVLLGGSEADLPRWALRRSSLARVGGVDGSAHRAGGAVAGAPPGGGRGSLCGDGDPARLQSAARRPDCAPRRRSCLCPAGGRPFSRKSARRVT